MGLDTAVQDEESLFQTAIVPLKLEISGRVVWLNPKPSSPHFCRPPHLQYKKGTKEVTVAKKKINCERLTFLINKLPNLHLI